MMKQIPHFLGMSAVVLLALVVNCQAQTLRREMNIPRGGTVEIVNAFGRVSADAPRIQKKDDVPAAKMILTASPGTLESEVRISGGGGRLRVEVVPLGAQKRIDLDLKLPLGTNLRVRTEEGEVRVAGSFASVEVRTETGTIAADVPLDDVRYAFRWTQSRPRYLSEVELDPVKEKSAGRFVISGRLSDKEKPKPDGGESGSGEEPESDRPLRPGDLDFTTARGIVLLNVNPAEVPSDLTERPLTNAAKAVVRSGDSLLTEAIRRASPKYFGEYAATLPPMRREPTLAAGVSGNGSPSSDVKRVVARVIDINNRALSDLKKEEFEITESGEKREVLSVEPVTTPFNLVLLLDVSGSVENYVDFIRKAARSFIDTADPKDRIAIVTFSEDVKVLSGFSSDRPALSASLDSFDAGGGTGYYDSLAYVLADTLKPLRGERMAIVVLSDGDDNRSFLPFDSLLGSIQESGALIYPLYVPSGLIAASKMGEVNSSIDPLRRKYMSLTTKAEGEGEKLASASGGVYYPIRQLGEIQKAYDDIVLQLRTAYTLTFRSDMRDRRANGAAPRLKVRVRRENTFVKIGSVTAN